MIGGQNEGQWRFTRIDFDRSRQTLSPEVSHLLHDKMVRCNVTGDTNTVVRIGKNTYVDVNPRTGTSNLVGWSLGTNGSNGRFFEIERMLNKRNGELDIVKELGNPKAVWNVTCVPDTKHYHIDDAKQAYKVLRIVSINGIPLDRIMSYWIPILHSLGRDSRGSAWRMPSLYMTMRHKRIQRALGAHIPLTQKMIDTGSVGDLFKDGYDMSTVQCIFDMSDLNVEKVGKNFEYLIASGTLSSGKPMSVPLVLGVYNAGLFDRPDV